MNTTSRNLRFTLITLVAILISAGLNVAGAQGLAEFEDRLTEFTLDNGLTFLVLERHNAPVVSFNTHANVGAVDEVKGITGIAHLFEHMAFKGSRNIGTRDYRAEEEALVQIDAVFLELKAERAKAQYADPNTIEKLEARLAEAQQNAQNFIVHDEFEEILTLQGSAGRMGIIPGFRSRWCGA